MNLSFKLLQLHSICTLIFLGVCKIWTKSFWVNLLNSTRIGNRPWSSGIRSDGLEKWNAPAAMNKIWSVWIMPYFVFTALPSTIGNKSLWTPSRLTSGPPPPFWLPAILSISSIKIIPVFSALLIASSTACYIY